MKGCRILLVDDEEELVRTVCERMKLRRLEVDAAVSGEQAVERFRAAPYAAVVLDVKMPGMSGLETLAVIKRERPAVPVIMITGHESPHERQACLSAGAFDYLVKPVGLEALIDKIKEAVGA